MMGTDSANGNSRNGNGRGPFEEATVSDEDGRPLPDVFERLVTVMLSEAVARRCSEILVDVGEDCCPVHFVRGSERLKIDSLPVRLFGPLKDRVARMCRKEDCQGQGTFTSSLKRTETSAKAYAGVKVAVDFADSGLRLTITDFKSTP
jgi:hypothetical protein